MARGHSRGARVSRPSSRTIRGGRATRSLRPGLVTTGGYSQISFGIGYQTVQANTLNDATDGVTVIRLNWFAIDSENRIYYSPQFTDLNEALGSWTPATLVLTAPNTPAIIPTNELVPY